MSINRKYEISDELRDSLEVSTDDEGVFLEQTSSYDTLTIYISRQQAIDLRNVLGEMLALDEQNRAAQASSAIGKIDLLNGYVGSSMPDYGID